MKNAMDDCEVEKKNSKVGHNLVFTHIEKPKKNMRRAKKKIK